jgi:hypothetical protein
VEPRPFILPVRVIVRGVEHAGTYDAEGDVLTVYYGEDCMKVELGGAVPKTRAEDVLRALVRRAQKKKPVAQ